MLQYKEKNDFEAFEKQQTRLDDLLVLASLGLLQWKRDETLHIAFFRGNFTAETPSSLSSE